MFKWILSVGLLMLFLTGCSPVAVRALEGNDSAGSSVSYRVSDAETKAVETGTDLTGNGQKTAAIVYRAIKLPSQYFITYEVSGEDGIVKTVSKAVDDNGNIYYKSGQEYLFLQEGKNYVLYQREDGTFVKQDGDKYQKTYVDELTEDFNKYVEKGRLTADGSPNGEVSIAGRSCDVYSITISFANFEQGYQYAVDQETNACLELLSEKTISGFKKEGEESFGCIRFDTGQIDLEKEFLQK